MSMCGIVLCLLSCQHPPSPHPAGLLRQSVSSLSSPVFAGNTTLEANEMQRRQSALQRLLLASASDSTPLLVHSLSSVRILELRIL